MEKFLGICASLSLSATLNIVIMSLQSFQRVRRVLFYALFRLPLNVDAHFIYKIRRSRHVSPLMEQLLWLPINKCIYEKFDICVQGLQCL